ncbi:hypothetical protein [Streptodolium elevatio]
MPDELQELARVAAANVVRAIGTESWQTVRGSLLNLLMRHGDPGAATWVDAFGSMIEGADGREQNGLRDAAYARFESVFSGLLTTRPDAAAEVALLVLPSSGPGAHSAPGTPGAPGAHAAPAAPNMVKDPYSSAPQSSPQQAAPHASQPQGFPPPSQFPAGGASGPGQGQGLPPMPPGPPPATPYGAPAGAMYQQAPAQGPPQGPYAGAPYQGGQPPMPGGASSGKWLIGGLAAVVVIGAVFGGIALFGGSDDDDCPSASAASSGAAGTLSAVANPSSKCGGVGPAGQSGKGGSDGKGGTSGNGNAATLSGPWSGTYDNKVPATLSGSFSITLEQSGSSVEGQLDLDVADCDLSGPVDGTVTGDKVQLRSSGGSSDTIRLEGKLSGDRLTGTYTTTCNDASGTWEAEQG